jgi:hypothetical protein
MRRDEEIGLRHGPVVGEAPLRRLSKREIDQRIAQIAAEVSRAFEAAPGERVDYLGEELWPRLIDTRKFIRIMSRHLVFN